MAKKNITGILLLDKSLNTTSNAILQHIKHLFGAKKAGHTGSLDPLATGMLPICFGEATKLSQYLLESDKYYRVTARLGIKTTTGDAEGDIISERLASDITNDLIEKILPLFRGEISQIPPMYSAIKHKGKPLYKLARQGVEIERQSRIIYIYALNLENLQNEKAVFFVHCSKGTYIRTLVEDIGDALGCGAYVSDLRRVSISPYEDAKMYSLKELELTAEEQGQDALLNYLIPVESAVSHFPIVKLSASSIFYLRAGQSIMLPNLSQQGLARLFSHTGEFVGIGEVLENGRVAPLGVLKSEKIKFIPELPEIKKIAIQKLKMSQLNKIGLLFNKTFWPKNVVIIGYNTHPEKSIPLFFNYDYYFDKPILLGAISGEAAFILENAGEKAFKERTMQTLRELFGQSIPDPLATITTNWCTDPFSQGSYSYIPVDANGEAFDFLAEPVNNKLFFAGEATYRACHSTVQGAYLSGIREAKRIVEKIKQ